MHEHTKRCYWDYLEAHWVCRPDVAEPEAAVEFPATIVSADEPVAAVADAD